jgi:hypothetical protein
MAQLAEKILSLRMDILKLITNELMDFRMLSIPMQETFHNKVLRILELTNNLTELAFMVEQDSNDQQDLNIGMTE